MGNPFVHVELNTTDLAKAKTFYTQLFDWQVEDTPMQGGETYTILKVGDGTGGGMLKHPMPGAPSTWIAYVAVAGVAEATKKAKALGATIIRDVTQVPDMGAFSIVQDPTGAVLGLWESKRG